MTANARADAPYHHGNLRPVLIAFGRDLLERNGLRGLSLREVAKRADVSHAAPVHHFRSMSGLLTACKADGFRELCEALDDVADDPPASATGRICRMAVAYLDFAERSPVLFRLMFDRDSAPDESEDFRMQSRRAYTLLETAVRATMDAGRDDAETFDIRLNGVWSLVHGFSILHNEKKLCRTSPEPLGPPDMLRKALTIYLGG